MAALLALAGGRGQRGFRPRARIVTHNFPPAIFRERRRVSSAAYSPAEITADMAWEPLRHSHTNSDEVAFCEFVSIGVS